MMNREDIIQEYQRNEEEIKRLLRKKELIKDLFKNFKKIEVLVESDKYGDLLVMSKCTEKPSRGKVVITFCLERCVIKCKDFDFVKKRYPDLLKYVGKLNDNHYKILQKIKEIF